MKARGALTTTSPCGAFQARPAMSANSVRLASMARTNSTSVTSPSPMITKSSSGSERLCLGSSEPCTPPSTVGVWGEWALTASSTCMVSTS